MAGQAQRQRRHRARPHHQGTDRRHHQGHQYQHLRFRPSPVRSAGRVHDPWRHPRARGDGRRRGGRQGRGRPEGRRPRGDPVQHLLRPLLHVRTRPPKPMRDNAEPGPGHRSRAVRLFEALRRGAGRPGRVPPRPAGPIHPHQGARGRARRTLRLPVRRVANRVAGGGVRKRAAGRNAGDPRPRPDRLDGVQGGQPALGLPCDRRRHGAGPHSASAGDVRRRHRHEPRRPHRDRARLDPRPRRRLGHRRRRHGGARLADRHRRADRCWIPARRRWVGR